MVKLIVAKLDEELGISEYDYKNEQTDNSRTGSYKKTVSSSQCDVELTIPSRGSV